MAGFLRGKQAGIQNDLSAAILPGLFAPDDQARFGINSQIGSLAYDPVQSLLAIGTNETQFGSGQIYVFGQNRVQVVLHLPRRASVKTLQFVADRLISVDSKNEVTIWDLATNQKVASLSPPGMVTSMLSDPSLDWLFLGLQNGDIVVYDIEADRLAPLRLPNFWREKSPRSRLLAVLSLQLHPRDIGKLLIGYPEGAVIYSFKQNKATKYFEYEVPAGAPGGMSDPVSVKSLRKPHLTQAFWHPTGTFVAGAYDDSTLVFWDPQDSRVVMARTVTDTNVNKPGTKVTTFGNTPGSFALKEPFAKVVWCAKDNPDDTGILIAGGMTSTQPEKGMTFLELGPTPVYATSSWQVLASHFDAKRQHFLPTPAGAEVIDFCLIPRSSPHFAGAQDPIAILALLNSGELITLSFPTGHPISPTNQLHPSVSFVHPFVLSIAVSTVDRVRWLGMKENRQQGPQLLRGGAGSVRPKRRYEARNIIQMAHGDGTVRIFDAGHMDEIENAKMLQVDVARAVDRFDEVNITSMSMGNSTGEMAVGTSAGEAVIYRWDVNKLFGQDSPSAVKTVAGGLTDISTRAEHSLKQGLQPFVLYDMGHGPISALKVSEVGFVGVGSEGGIFSIIDLRGPAVIFTGALSDFIRSDKRGSFMKKGVAQSSSQSDWPVVIEFGIMTLDNDNYSSIACFVGTNQGKVATFKILPESNGGYSAQFAGVSVLSDKIISITPIVADTGSPAVATGTTMGGLRSGKQTHGTLVVVTQSEARIFRPATAKGAHKSWDDVFCDAASVVEFEDRGYALIGVFGDGTTRCYSLPGLKEIGGARLDMVDKTRISSSLITSQGDIFVWTGPSEIAMVSVWGAGQSLHPSQDMLFNPEAPLAPPRPTISNMQWISGTQHMSPMDLDLLIGGPDRPPGKRMLAAAAEEDRAARASGQAAGPSRVPGTQSTEGWGDYMTRQLNERTEKLNIMGDGMDRMQENSQGWANDVDKMVKKQKRGLLMGAVKGRFF